MTKNARLNFNNPAPDVTVKTVSGELIQLSSLWKSRPLLLAFTRHFGCTQCKEMLVGLVEGKDDIQRSGLALAVIMQGAPEETAQFAQEFAPGLFCLSDEERKSYRAFGLERGNLFQTFLNLNVWKAISRARKKGFYLENPPRGQDAMQMSGLFIINKAGLVVFPYYFDHIADHPPLDLLLKGALATQWDKPFEGPLGSD